MSTGDNVYLTAAPVLFDQTIFRPLRPLLAQGPLLGVVGAEVIASERGLGQQLAYLGSTFNVNGVWSLLFDLAVIGVLIMKLMNWIERRLLHWQ